MADPASPAAAKVRIRVVASAAPELVGRLLRVPGPQAWIGRAEGCDVVVDEIVRLGEGFSIVTEYTSFLVLENDAEYRRWKIERRNALRLERDRAHQERVRDKLATLRQRAADIGPMAPSGW